MIIMHFFTNHMLHFVTGHGFFFCCYQVYFNENKRSRLNTSISISAYHKSDHLFYLKNLNFLLLVGFSLIKFVTSQLALCLVLIDIPVNLENLFKWDTSDAVFHLVHIDQLMFLCCRATTALIS